MSDEASAALSANDGLKAWLLSDAPGSVFQARCQRFYIAWRAFSQNPPDF